VQRELGAPKIAMQQKKVFLSHASKDKLLADRLADLLTAGCAVAPNEILCTSLEGKGVPAGAPSFIEYLRQQVQEPNLVIPLLSESFFDSDFCLCELGAVWGMGLPSFPIVVPPMDKGRLRATLAVTQAGYVTSASYLHELGDAVSSRIGTSVPTSTWSVKRDAFLNGLDELLKSLPGPTSVSADRLREAQDQYQVALKEIAKKENEVNSLKHRVADLEKCKDKAQVRAADRDHSSSHERFEKLVDAAKTALRKLRTATV